MFTKKYCCSNNPRTVATILALIDIEFGSIFTILFSIFTYMLIMYPECLKSMVASNPPKQQDIHMLLTWGPWKQAFMLSVPLVSSISNLCMGILLLVGSRKENLRLVKTWFFLHIIFCILSVIFFIPEVIFTQDKAIIIFLSLLNYIYDFYALWIVKCFLNDLHIAKVSRGSITQHLPPLNDVEADVDVDTEFTSSIEKF